MKPCKEFNGKYFPSAPWPYNFKYRTNLTMELTRLVCQCTGEELLELNDNYTKRVYFDRNLKYCGNCERLSLDQLHKCYKCEHLFIKDFLAPSYCNLKTICFNCWYSNSTEQCEHSSNVLETTIRYSKFQVFEERKKYQGSIEDLLDDVGDLLNDTTA